MKNLFLSFRKTAGKRFFYIFFIVFIIIIVYSNSFWSGFHYDDYASIVKNKYIRSASPIFVFKNNNPFRFVGFYSFALNWLFFGFKKVFYWHLINIVLHILCSLALFFLILNVLPLIEKDKKYLLAFAGSIFFAVHPSLTEAVNYIQARHILFLSLFLLIFLNLLILYAKRKSNIYLFLIFLVSLCSVFSRETGFIYVFLFGSVFYIYFKKGVGKKLIFLYGGIFVLFGVCFINFFGRFKTIRFADWSFFSENSYAFFKYLLFIIPYNGLLSVDHNFKGFENHSFFNLFFWPFLMFLYSAFAVVVKRKDKSLSFFLLIPVLWHIPYMLIQKSSELLVEYKFYFMLSAYAVVLAVFLGKLSEKNILKGKHIVIFCLIYIVFAGRHTYERNIVWKNEIYLWEDCVSKGSKNARAYCNLAKAYYDAGYLKLAEKNVLKSLKLDSKNKYALYLAGTIALDLGNYDNAIEYFAELTNIDKNNPDVFMNLGYAFACKRKYENALKCFFSAVAIDNCYARAYFNIGNIWSLRGNMKEAVKYYKKAVKCEINFKPAIESLAYYYAGLGNYKRAYMFYYWAYLCDKKDKKIKLSLKSLMNKINN